MSALQLNGCNTLIDKQLKKIPGLQILVDNKGNKYSPWYYWYNKTESAIRFDRLSEIDTLPVELLRLQCTKTLDEDQVNNLTDMLKSPDRENFMVALEVLKNFRKMRLQAGKKQKKKHVRH